MQIRYIHLSIQEAYDLVDENWFVTAVVPVEFDEIASLDCERVLDYISSAVTGSELMQDLSWKVVGFEENNMVLLEVTGKVEHCYDWSDLLPDSADEETVTAQEWRSHYGV